MPKILYIDDSAAELGAAATALRAAGYQVETHTSVAAARAHVLDSELVLIDFHMPGTDGGEVLQELKEAIAGRESRPAFYLYTSDKDVGSEYRELGFDGRLILKGNSEALVRQVDAAFRIMALRTLRPD